MTESKNEGDKCCLGIENAARSLRCATSCFGLCGWERREMRFSCTCCTGKRFGGESFARASGCFSFCSLVVDYFFSAGLGASSGGSVVVCFLPARLAKHGRQHMTAP